MYLFMNASRNEAGAASRRTEAERRFIIVDGGQGAVFVRVDPTSVSEYTSHPQGHSELETWEYIKHLFVPRWGERKIIQLGAR